MWGHRPTCPCSICTCLSRVFWVISEGSPLPGFLTEAAGCLRLAEGELRDIFTRALARGRPDPPATGVGAPPHAPPPSAPAAPTGEGKGKEPQGETPPQVSQGTAEAPAVPNDQQLFAKAKPAEPTPREPQPDTKVEPEKSPKEESESANIEQEPAGEEAEASKPKKKKKSRDAAQIGEKKALPVGQLDSKGQEGRRRLSQVMIEGEKEPSPTETGRPVIPRVPVVLRDRPLDIGPAPRVDWAAALLGSPQVVYWQKQRPSAAGQAAKAKAVMRRPASRRGSVVRRPAADEGAVVARRLLAESVAELSRLGHIWVKKAVYYHTEVDLAGKVAGVRVQDGNIFVDLDATGTKDERLLKSLTGKSGKRVALHICPPGCGNVLSDEFLVHAKEFAEIEPKDDAWFTNLVQVHGEGPEEVDEMAGLRRDAALERGEADDKERSPPKQKKKKKEAKKQKKERDAGEESGKDKKREASEESLGREVGQKDLKEIFAGTGLDPNPTARQKFVRRAKKLGRGKKKKKKASSGTSSSSTYSSSRDSTSRGRGAGLFSSEKRMKTIWKRYPGCLACSAIYEARESLMTSSGTLWEVDRQKIPPIATQYTRQNLSSSMSPPMLQEAVTIAACLDGLLMGKVAYTADILTQRLKSLESHCRGSHWSISRQLELIRAEPLGIVEEAEGLDAAKAATERYVEAAR
eukprot:s267_g1.t1